MNIDSIKSVYFVGAGGIGMSALVRYFLSLGKVVAGYDRTPSALIYDNLAPNVQKMMIDKGEVLATVEAKKGELDVLVSLGAGDIENFAPQITDILTSAL